MEDIDPDLVRRVALRRAAVRGVADLLARAAATDAGGAAVRRDGFLDAIRAMGCATGVAADETPEPTMAEVWRRISGGGESVAAARAARCFRAYIESLRAELGADPVLVAVALGRAVLDPSRRRILSPASVRPCPSLVARPQ